MAKPFRHNKIELFTKSINKLSKVELIVNISSCLFISIFNISICDVFEDIIGFAAKRPHTINFFLNIFRVCEN